MNSLATILYARLHNVPPPDDAAQGPGGAELLHEMRSVLQEPIAKHDGVVAQQRPDSILAIFGNDQREKPDHARRAISAAVQAVHDLARLNRRIAARTPQAPPPRLALATGVHLGNVEVAPARNGSGGAVRATGEAVEVARLLECTAPDLGWSIVASQQARRAAGLPVESGRFGSVALPDSSFVDIAEITGLAPQRGPGNAAGTYQAFREAIVFNQRLQDRPRDLSGAAARAARNAATHFSIEGYRILRKIGEGGMASIYLAAGPSDEAQVLKVMRIVSGGQDDSLQRFIQEFALLAQVKHPNVAQIHRQGFSSGHAYIAMEHFSQGDLRARIAQGISRAEALAYVKQTAAALQAIHRAGIVHRDLKPDNLMLRKDGGLALADFGIAKHVAMSITDTAHGEVVGTPYYLSPEQAMGQLVDQRCDLYSLGIILYEMLTGTKPYRASTAQDLLDLHVNGPVPSLPTQHQDLQPILERLMAKDCERRYPSAQHLLAHLFALGL